MKDLRDIEVPGNDGRWYETVGKVYGLKTFDLETSSGIIYLSQSRSLSGTKYLSSGPYLTDGGALKRPLTDEDVQIIRSKVRELNCQYALIKSRFQPKNQIEPIFIKKDFVTFVLDLNGGEDTVLNSRLDGKTRNQLRKALKGGFEIRIGHKELQNSAYEVLSKCWRDLGTPSHSYDLLAEILSTFGPDACWLHVVFSANNPISAALVFKTEDTVHHPWAGTIREYKSTSVNNLLYWSIIQEACRKNVKYFDMGRSTVNQGTFLFKKSWGAEKVPLYYVYVGANAHFQIADSQLAIAMTHVWKFTPLFLANKLGPPLIKTVM